MLTRTPRNILGKYRGCTPRQIARLMCRAISMAATGRHGVCRFDLAEEMIAEAMDLTDWATLDERTRMLNYLREAIHYAANGAVAQRPRPNFKPLP